MRPFDTFISRLQSVKTAHALPGERRALACCPAHEDRHPSLDLRELPDGRLLILCRANGCGALDIVEAVGLDLSDLFPRDLRMAPVGRKGRGAGHAASMPQLISPQEVSAAAFHVFSCAVTMREERVLCNDAILELARICGRLERAGVAK